MSELKEQGLRYNERKPQWSLVSFKALEPMVRVLEFGAKKYARDNWKKGLDRFQLLESMQRHVAALIDGEDTDEESKLHHIGHILCNAMFYSFHYVILKKKESKPESKSIINEVTLFPVEVKITNTGFIYVKLLGQTEFHSGKDYSEYIRYFLDNKMSYKIDSNSTADTTIYKKI